MQNEETKKKWSAMSVWALILSLFGCTSLIGLILAIVDLASGDDTKKHTGSKVAIALSVIGLIGGIALFSMSGSDDSATVENPTEAVIENEVESADLEEETTSKKTTSEETASPEYVIPGGSFEVDGLKITVNDCDLDFSDYDDSYGLHTLDEGKKYVKVSFTCENNASEDKYVSIYDYDCYADGTLCEQKYFDSDFMNANISSGRNVSFETYYIVPSDVQELELEYTANVWTDEKILIKLQ